MPGRAEVSRRATPVLRRLAIGIAALVAVVGGLYFWAHLSTDSSTVARALVWRDSDMADQERFPARVVPASRRSAPLPVASEIAPRAHGAGAPTPGSFDRLLQRTHT